MGTKKFYLNFVLVLVFVLSGCAGKDFVRPDSQQLILGKSSQTDILKLMGEPYKTGEVLKNNERIKNLHYAYASTGGESKYPGVIPARGLTFSTFNDQMVGQEFVSSFAADITDFDDSKITQIIKGKTTRSEVIALLGKPSGEAIYPMIKDKNGTAIVYGYNHVKGSAFNLQFYAKLLIVSFDTKQIVTDVEYVSSGEK